MCTNISYIFIQHIEQNVYTYKSFFFNILLSFQTHRVLPHFSESKIDGLNPGGSYRVCIRADNIVGEGEFSPWTKVFTLPKEVPR